MQKLVMPFKQSTMVCGYKTAKYLSAWGYPHYGVDISTYQGTEVDDHTVYASGTGKVVAAGWDSKLGGAVCIQYDDAYNHATRETVSVVARYMHMQEVLVKTGDTVTTDTPVGIEGKEGTTGYHLHLEFDSDLAYPKWTPQVSKGLSFWVRGVDSTIDPSDLLHQSTDRKTLPDNWADGWLREKDRNIPFADAAESGETDRSITITELADKLRAAGIEIITL